MIGLIQRVKSASVDVDEQRMAAIGSGILLLLGVEKGDTKEGAEKLIDRVLAYRIFSDDGGRMNHSLIDVKGGLLVVPQFTLAADTQKGLRPSFASAAPPDLGQELFAHALSYAKQKHAMVGSGIFGADMQVHLINDGPVTFHLKI